MLKSKRFNGSMAAVVVLAVILAIAVTAGATLAWFASQDSATTDFAMSDSVIVAVADEAGALTSDQLDFQIPAGFLVPGMTIYPTVYADIETSTTSALLRALVDVSVVFSNKTVIPAGWNLVDAEPDYYTDGDYAGTDLTTLEMVYNYLTAQMETYLFNTIIAKANGWYFDADLVDGDTATAGDQAYVGDGYFYFVGNGASYSKVMSTLPNVEELNAKVAKTYATAGNLLTPAGQANELDNDTIYGAFTGQTGNRTLNGSAAIIDNNLIASIVTSETGETWNETNSEYDTVTYNEGWTADHAHVPFLVRPILVPVEWTNAVANAQISIDITFEAIQDFLIDITVADFANNDVNNQVLPTLAYAKAVFEDAKA